jgi:uncharacterized membrane protein
LKISDAINIIQDKKWTKINNFNVTINFDEAEPGEDHGPIDFARMCGWTSNNITNDDVNASLISVTTPQYQNQTINQYVSYEWRFHQGRDDLYRFSMTFRDYDQMKLYNLFRKLYIKGKGQYYNKIKMNIKVNLAEDYGVREIPVFQTSTAIIENVSQLQFSHNTENQVAEFAVNFIANTTEVNGTSSVQSGQSPLEILKHK